MKQPNKAQKTRKVDSNSSSLRGDTALSPSLRADEIGVAKQGAAAASLVIHKQQKQKGTKADSSVKMDCHADKSARNDRKTAPSKKQILATTPHSHCETSAGSRGNPKKADSRSNKPPKATILQTPQSKQAEVVFDSESQAAGFTDDFVGCQGGGEGIYLSGNEQAPAADSRKSAAKPTPETQKAQSTNEKQTPTSTDILTCLANLSTDEVFTPPHIVNAMLDLLPQELFSDPASTFLDPACKSGVFLREIARRLMLGLEPHFPEPSKRIAHILTHQLYGIAITELTALLSRRTLYGSKDVHNPTYSIPQKSGAALPQGGNIYYAPTPHSFKNAKCTYCGASQSQYDRDSTLESHAYAFIHELEPLEEFFASVKAPSPSQADLVIHKSTQVDSKAVNSATAESMDCHAANAARNDSKTSPSVIARLPQGSRGNPYARNDKQSHPQGVPMSFSVIITNPPYQLATTQGTAQATPLYNKFIDRAKALNPKHIVMIVPARWYSGGMGLKSFRASMLNDSRLVELHDFPNASDCFPDNSIEGGVCYFRWDSAKEDSQRLLSDRGGGSISAKSTPTEMALS